MPKTDPEGALVFKSEKLVDGTLYAYLMPYKKAEDHTPTWTAETAKFGKLENVYELYTLSELSYKNKKYPQKDYYLQDRRSTSNDEDLEVIFGKTIEGENAKGELHDLAITYNSDSDNLIVAASYNDKDGKSHSIIDNTTSHATYVVYNYGEISSVVPKSTDPQTVADALQKLDGKAGAFVANTGTDAKPKYEYFVKVHKINTVYCSVYNPDSYTWKWADRTQLAKIEGKAADYYTKKKQDGTYENPLPSNYKEQLEVVFGDKTFTINPEYICGTSSWDGRYNRTLYRKSLVSANVTQPTGFENSLTPKKDKDGNVVAYVLVNGTKDEYYKASATDLTSVITLTVVDENNNVTHDVAATLVIECLDMYGNTVKVEVQFTIKKR